MLRHEKKKNLLAVIENILQLQKKTQIFLQLNEMQF